MAQHQILMLLRDHKIAVVFLGLLKDPELVFIRAVDFGRHELPVVILHGNGIALDAHHDAIADIHLVEVKVLHLVSAIGFFKCHTLH